MYASYIKHFLDISGAFILLLLLSPLMLMVSILIYIKMGKPVFFRQMRPGKDANIFCIYKFRSMENQKEGERLSDEKRLGSLGKKIRALSLDELPQLFNILKGEMSFIGPRPLLIDYLSLYNEEQNKRHNVKPGITGLAQVNGRNAISWKAKFEYDVDYVKHLSFYLDLKIIFLTIKKIIKRDGITSEGDVTTQAFKGNTYEK
ncbi:MAG: lipid carrier--UDP-N-acetylgalactosaminyltransferase [Arcobacter sp.]|nr:MAG: lipid carrier--UDP-N-acetylgalactosaminyltransferase [Arcobacter sp.]